MYEKPGAEGIGQIEYGPEKRFTETSVYVWTYPLVVTSGFQQQPLSISSNLLMFFRCNWLKMARTNTTPEQM